MSAGYRVLLLGCGELGSRHLQALSKMPEVGAIHVVDPSRDSLDLGRQRLLEVADRDSDTEYTWSGSIPCSADGGDLCISATRAQGRVAQVEEAATHGYDTFLLEKIVAPSVAQYDRLLDILRATGARAWVNCPMRTYEIHKSIRGRLSHDEPLTFVRTGGNQGLACNGIHALDLFDFFTGGGELRLIDSRIDEDIHPTKRRGAYDLSGSIHAATEDGSDFFLSYSGMHNAPDTILITSSAGRFMVDHITQQAYESTPGNDWTWTSMDFSENLLVSHRTEGIARKLLEAGQCELPTAEECRRPHRFLLETLSPHFERAGLLDADELPVT